MLLDFDAMGHLCRVTRGELGLLRMALHTIARALGRQMLEEERNRLETRLEHARRLETVGTLASGIAQDLAERLDHLHPPPPTRKPFPGHLPRERVVVPRPSSCANSGGSMIV